MERAEDFLDIKAAEAAEAERTHRASRLFRGKRPDGSWGSDMDRPRYAVATLPAALRTLQSLPPNIRERIRDRLDALATDPRPHGIKALQGGAKGYLRSALATIGRFTAWTTIGFRSSLWLLGTVATSIDSSSALECTRCPGLASGSGTSR